MAGLGLIGHQSRALRDPERAKKLSIFWWIQFVHIGIPDKRISVVLSCRRVNFVFYDSID